MSFEVILTPCQKCHRVFQKRISESRARRENRRYCSLVCAKADFKERELGWFSHGSQTISKKKDPIDDIAPRIWTDQEFRDFEELYPELSAFD